MLKLCLLHVYANNPQSQQKRKRHEGDYKGHRMTFNCNFTTSLKRPKNDK